MKYIKLYVLTILCIGILSAIYFPIYQTRATPTSEVISLSTDPSKSLINFYNMAPGDKISKKLHVNNDGNVDLNYTLTAIKEAGNQTLYEKLSLKVIEGNVDIYDGSLKDLKNLDLGELLSFENDELLFTIELPLEVSNEVKRKSTSVAFNFIGSGLNEPKENKNDQLPKTATNYFNYLLFGVVFITLGTVLILFKRRIIKGH